MLNAFLTNEYTQVIQKMIREVVNDPKTYRGSAYLPSVAIPVETILTEVVEATGGLTSEHVPGTSPGYIQSFGTRVQEFSPAYYKEAIHYDEKKLLYLRKLGDNERNVRGVQQYIELDIDRLNRRIEERMEKLRWDVIFNGSFASQWKTFYLGIPGANKATPIGQDWATVGGVINNSANPIQDIRYWLNSYASFRKYTISKIVMNPTTARWILDNTNTRSYVTSFGANPRIGDYDVNKVMNFLIPGCPEIEIYKGWYQSESTVAGKITVSDAIFFINDGDIFFEVSSLPGDDKIGEMVQTLNLASGTIQNPGFGKFLVIDDNTAVGTQGGPKNPFVDLVGGVYCGPKLDRAFDVLTAKVISY